MALQASTSMAAAPSKKGVRVKLPKTYGVVVRGGITHESSTQFANGVSSRRGSELMEVVATFGRDPVLWLTMGLRFALKDPKRRKQSAAKISSVRQYLLLWRRVCTKLFASNSGNNLRLVEKLEHLQSPKTSVQYSSGTLPKPCWVIFDEAATPRCSPALQRLINNFADHRAEQRLFNDTILQEVRHRQGCDGSLGPAQGGHVEAAPASSSAPLSTHMALANANENGVGPMLPSTPPLASDSGRAAKRASPVCDITSAAESGSRKKVKLSLRGALQHLVAYRDGVKNGPPIKDRSKGPIQSFLQGPIFVGSSNSLDRPGNSSRAHSAAPVSGLGGFYVLMYVYSTTPVASTGSLRAGQAGPRGWRRSRLGGRAPTAQAVPARATFFGILRSGSHLRPLPLSGRNQRSAEFVRSALAWSPCHIRQRLGQAQPTRRLVCAARLPWRAAGRCSHACDFHTPLAPAQRHLSVFVSAQGDHRVTTSGGRVRRCHISLQLY